MHPPRYKHGTVRMKLPGVSFIVGSAVLRTVPGLWGIAASKTGDIWSVRSGRWYKLKATIGGGRAWDGRGGYLRVKIRTNGHSYPCYVHRLVTLAWHGAAPEPHYEVDHDDTNHLNNNKDNLLWIHPADHHEKHPPPNAARGQMTTDDDWADVLSA